MNNNNKIKTLTTSQYIKKICIYIETNVGSLKILKTDKNGLKRDEKGSPSQLGELDRIGPS